MLRPQNTYTHVREIESESESERESESFCSFECVKYFHNNIKLNQMAVINQSNVRLLYSYICMFLCMRMHV